MESAVSLPVEEAISNPGNCDKPLPSSRLIYLSNLNSAEMALFEQTWAVIEPERRRQIVHQLVELAEDNFELDFDLIFRYCLKDEDDGVRSKAIEGLSESEEPSLINPLINLLEQDSSEKVQAAAAIALGNFALLAELNKLHSCHSSKVGPALLAVINNRSKPLEVRRRALEAVAPLSIPEVTTTIIETYYSDSSKFKASTIYAVGKNCSPSWLPILLEELGSAEDDIRHEAAAACGELGEAEAVPYLIKLINDLDTNVQLAAIRALGKIGNKDAKNQLNRCLSHPSQVIREAAALAIDELAVVEDLPSFRGIV